jgi:hypothetical protein
VLVSVRAGADEPGGSKREGVAVELIASVEAVIPDEELLAPGGLYAKLHGCTSARVRRRRPSFIRAERGSLARGRPSGEGALAREGARPPDRARA